MGDAQQRARDGMVTDLQLIRDAATDSPGRIVAMMYLWDCMSARGILGRFVSW